MAQVEFDTGQYVRQTAALLGIPLDDEQIEDVTKHMLIAAGLAKEIMSIEFGPDDEPAPRFEP